MRALIVEDEPRMAQTIQHLLGTVRLLSDIAPDGEAGLDCALSGIYDIILLDIMLPKMDGLQVLEQIRSAGIQTPVLILTARGTVPDRIEGLDRGADYYLSKPFAAGELLACIRALLRRPQELRPERITFADLSLSVETGMLERGGMSIQLSKRELEILRLLMEEAGRPVDRETLILKVWGYENAPESNVLDTYISFLRKKLTHIRSETQIVSRRHIGYCLKGGTPCSES